jgi:hypothetical protein
VHLLSTAPGSRGNSFSPSTIRIWFSSTGIYFGTNLRKSCWVYKNSHSSNWRVHMQKQTNAKSKYFELAIPGYSPYKELYVSKILYQFNKPLWFYGWKYDNFISFFSNTKKWSCRFLHFNSSNVFPSKS